MKIKALKNQGSIQIPCLIICTIIGIALASYFKLVRVQNLSVARSQIWNSAIPVCEAGIEEGLSQINSVLGTNYAINGWVINGDHFEKEGTLGENRYFVKISTNTYPTIEASAFVKNYIINGPMLGAINAPDIPTAEIKRSVRVTTTRWSTGMKGMIAKYNIDMNGITEMDSFDSEDERYSTRGRFDPAKRKDNGFAGSVSGDIYGTDVFGSVATGPLGTVTGTVGDFAWTSSNTGVQPGHYANDLNLAFPEVQVPFNGGALSPMGGSLTLTNFDYWSTMITTNVPPVTPPASPVTTNFFGTMVTTTYPFGVSPFLIKTNTTATHAKAPLPPAGTYINLTQQGNGAWYDYDLITSYSYPSVTYSYSLTAPNNTATTANYKYIFSGNQYQMNDLSLNGSDMAIVTGTNVSLYIPGDFSMSGSSKLIITPGASLKIYVGGRTQLSGNGIFNYTLDASHFMYYGLPTNNRIDISGNAAFTGCIYAPSADLKLDGAGTDVYDIVGATITKTSTLKGHFRFHYDEKLGRTKILSQFTVASWTEF